ncbi:MAG: MotA/TolQ/ExbB proton channel family protein [Spirochaetaceae bacterium]|jgi:chemotaxis protein MotA|nr:MotA/TolQ/ExbB proton channel family protein [Spirochaetaceae bacterium]
MDISSLIGIAGAFGMVVFSVLSSGGSLLSIMDLPSFLMVVLGSYFALLLSSSLSDGLSVFGIISRTFKVPTFNEQGLITKMMAFSEKARREGLLALEDELEDLDDEFMKKGLRLVVDGTDAEIIRDLMELELSQMQGRHADKIGIINMWAALGPGLGMLGTVVGLISMLKNLEDKASIGPNMALALVTTLYGSMLANLLMIPFAAKLRGHDAKETMVKEMIIEGVLSIQAGDNTRILAMKLLAYLTPVERKAVEAEVLKD